MVLMNALRYGIYQSMRVSLILNTQYIVADMSHFCDGSVKQVYPNVYIFI